MKTPAEKCAERILQHINVDLIVMPNRYKESIAAIIQSEYAPKSPDKCAEQAAERIAGLILNDHTKWLADTAAIITESYAPTIQVAREAIQAFFDHREAVFAAQINGKPIPDGIDKCLDQLRTALDQLPKCAAENPKGQWFDVSCDNDL